MSDDPFNRPPPPSHLQPVVPVLSRRGEFLPTVGREMSIDVGGEIVSAKVTDIITRDAIVVEIIGIVVDKANHGYRKGSVIPVQRTWNGMQEVWTPISERATREREHLDRVKRQLLEDEEEKRRAMAREAPPPEPPPPPAPVEEETHYPHAQPAEEPRRVLGPRRSHIAR